MKIKRWSVAPINKDRAHQLSQETGYPFFLAMLLEIRGFYTKEQAQALFETSASFADPFLLKDMDLAVARIRRAIDEFSLICVYGDYDADGVTATALLYSYLESVGANVMFHIPVRDQEGYGMNLDALTELHQQGVQLVITVDNGIASVAEAEHASKLGMDLVITDHHRPRDILPQAVAVVNPHRLDCAYPFKDLSGVGVAFKLVCALEGDEADLATLLDNYADLVAIGTVGDIVSLTGENRALVRAGLPLLSQSDRPGICALLEFAGMQGKTLSATNVAFTLVPRINATGRMGVSDRAVHLLLAEDALEAERLAEEICRDNDNRRSIEAEITAQALQLLQNEPQRIYERVVVVEGEGWHHGVIGIVASRITELYGKPSVVISYDETQAKASGRSVEGFSLFDAICHCAPLMTKFGGHPMAIGFSMPTEHLTEFRRQINAFAASLPGEMPPYTLHLDCKLNPAALSLDMPKQLAYLEPFGTDNPPPLFGLYGMQLKEIIPMGGGKHLRLRLQRDGTEVQCVKFRTTVQEFPYQVGNLLDLAVSLEVNVYREVETLSILVKDVRLSGVEETEVLEQNRLYEKAKRGEPLTDEQIVQLLPTREEFAVIYRCLTAHGGWQHDVLLLLLQLKAPQIGFAKLQLALDVLADCGLIELHQSSTVCRIGLKPAMQKVDLFASPVLKALQANRKDG